MCARLKTHSIMIISEPRGLIDIKFDLKQLCEVEKGCIRFCARSDLVFMAADSPRMVIIRTPVPSFLIEPS